MATEDFSMNNLLGEGAFSKSYRGNISISSYNGAVFVKRINKEFDHENPPFKHVVELLAGCNHVNVIKAIGYCDEANEKIIVYNFMPNGSLYDYLYNDQRHTCCLSVKQRLNICIGVAEGFAYLHKRDIIHCNLSSDNIFLDHELVPSISGFDLSMTRSTSPYSSPLLKDYKQGNEGYLAPECYEPNYEPDQKADVYAFGMFLLEMLCKKPPWKKLATLALEFSMKGQLPRTGKGCSGACEECSGACVNLIRDCLDIDSGKRPSMLQVVDELKLALRLQEYYRNGKTKCQQSCELNNRNLSPSCRSFLLSDIKKATDNFSNYIGQGAFGKVYSGNISGNRFYNGVVAVKRMSMAPEQGTPAYKKEIELVSACNHVNIINLIGFCEEEDEKILLYELMPNGSLYDYLYNDKHRVSQLTVEQRLEICIGVAKGLDYLHSRADSVIIHSDLKTDNILLDQNLVPKISDFGLSRTRDVGPSISKQTTNHIQGTEGYLAPECYEPGYKVSRKADVYAFGIVLLEVLCERPAWQRLVILALPFIRRGELRNFTPDYVGRHISSRCLRACENLIRDCLDTDAAKRPDMKQVVTKLEEALRLEKKYKNDHFLSLTDPQVFSSSCDHTPCHNYLLEETTLKGYI
ncbi:probable serine/threonine-protein kinase PBL22 [Rutidosis leptorrhynchoides]|uniref:probable serine/threonine-protein kinase PBL22 n=1 Tax=Rutidosis leptorrhynchoides TaxID=125765 RepID=UPI003A99A98B